ncbi:hypothetical protein [Demequina gelatinilytica]|uniref:hypothetical protein n=1 Tax=Demequina gelatinilytica TaxID=1638980 RepID=UPI0007867C2A|nr:hypothetical protein [Demequina gelatinilytica]
MSNAGAAEGAAAGGRRLAQADLPRAYAARPDADPLKAPQFWTSATPASGVPRARIAPEVPAPVDPAVVLRRLAELAVAEASTDVRVVPAETGPKPLPRRSDSRGGGALSGGVPPAPRPREDAAAPSRRSLRATRPEQEPAPDEQSDAAIRSSRVDALADLIPRLKGLSEDRRPDMRSLYALCYSMLACEGRAPADREVWRALLGLSKYDEDPGVRRIADAALTDLERHGTVPRGA